MKQAVKNLTKAVLFIVVFFVGLTGLYRVFRWKDTNGDYFSTFDALYSLEENRVDLVFVGPSFTYASFNPAQLWEEHGIASFTMAISGQDKNSALASLREVLKTQTPQVVMVDVYGSLYEEHGVRGNLYRNTISMELSQNSIELVQASVEKEEQLDFLLRWPIVHTRYRELAKYDFVQYMPSIYSLGFQYTFPSTPRERNWQALYKSKATPIKDVNRKWVDDMEALSREYGFELLFYATPGVYENTSREIINGVKEYLTKKELPFLDLDATELADQLDYAKDFADYTHLNYDGSVKLSRFMGNWLEERYSIPDHRGEEGYQAWEDALYYRKHVVADETLSHSFWLEEICRGAKEPEDMVIVVSCEGLCAEDAQARADCLEILGIDPKVLEDGGAWVLTKNDGIHSLEGEEIYRLTAYDGETMEVRREIDPLGEFVTKVSVGTTDYRNDTYHIDGMLLLVYDKLTETLVYQGTF